MNKTVTTYDNITAHVYFSTVDCFFFPVPLSRYIHVLLKKHDQTNDLFRGAAITIFDLRRYFFLPAGLLFTRPHHPVDASPTVCSLFAHTHTNAHTRTLACGLYGLGICSDCEFMKSWRLHPPPRPPLPVPRVPFFIVDCQKGHLWRVRGGVTERFTYGRAKRRVEEYTNLFTLENSTDGRVLHKIVFMMGSSTHPPNRVKIKK